MNKNSREVTPSDALLELIDLPNLREDWDQALAEDRVRDHIRRMTEMPAKNGRVLVVERDAVTLDRLATDLEGYGFKIDRATSGIEALSLAQENPCDLAVIDSRVLESFLDTGENIIFKLREKNAATRFILLLDDHKPASPAFEEAMQKLMNPIVLDETISKPVEVARLVRAILLCL